ncbi:MAG: peptide chain release factor 3 [Opitutales bacterium]|nr:peptide chain release factor 3 [Opitutales bacterium]
MDAKSEINRRRTFAIISHPDAGKTTLTEKFLLYGGAVNLAGGVKDRKAERATASDWMELEKQRGISVSSTVLQFEYEGFAVNLLDTPGHKDFSEDTYRVLTAVDAAVMVLDAAKGLETQTLKLFQVCRQRGIPIFTFINKCDRPCKNPLALLDEIEEVLGLQPYPITWPIGEGDQFQGVFQRGDEAIHWFERVTGGRKRATVETGSLADEAFVQKIPAQLRERFQEDLELLECAGTEFDRDAILAGKQTPVYFGSALNNFGVQLLLDGFLKYAPTPSARFAGERLVEPTEKAFSGFIFKIQANMDPRHRDRLAFVRVCSGKFTRDMSVCHTQTGKQLRLSFSHQLFGKDRETQDEAWPGDILGISGQSDFGIGDTLSEDNGIQYNAIPRFPPECFAYLHNTDTSNFKRFRSGIDQLLQEKVIQRFYPVNSVANIPLLGAVGALQFDVVCHRMENEYRAPCRLEMATWTQTRWLPAGVEEAELEGIYMGGNLLARDANDRLVILFENQWGLDYFQRENPDLSLSARPDGSLEAAPAS